MASVTENFSVKRPIPSAVKDEYFFAASDYYAAGRFAFWTRSYSVCGNRAAPYLEPLQEGGDRLPSSDVRAHDSGHR